VDSNQILSDDKDPQVLLVDGPKMRPTNPRWRRAAILKNRKKCHNNLGMQKHYIHGYLSTPCV